MKQRGRREQQVDAYIVARITLANHFTFPPMCLHSDNAANVTARLIIHTLWYSWWSGYTASFHRSKCNRESRREECRGEKKQTSCEKQIADREGEPSHVISLARIDEGRG